MTSTCDRWRIEHRGSKEVLTSSTDARRAKPPICAGPDHPSLPLAYQPPARHLGWRAHTRQLIIHCDRTYGRTPDCKERKAHSTVISWPYSVDRRLASNIGPTCRVRPRLQYV